MKETLGCCSANTKTNNERECEWMWRTNGNAIKFALNYVDSTNWYTAVFVGVPVNGGAERARILRVKIHFVNCAVHAKRSSSPSVKNVLILVWSILLLIFAHTHTLSFANCMNGAVNHATTSNAAIPSNFIEITSWSISLACWASHLRRPMTAKTTRSTEKCVAVAWKCLEMSPPPSFAWPQGGKKYQHQSSHGRYQAIVQSMNAKNESNHRHCHTRRFIIIQRLIAFFCEWKFHSKQ